MMQWRCTVKTPSNWMQTIHVEAYTHSDAVAFAESQTGGKCIMATVENVGTNDDNNYHTPTENDVSLGGWLVVGIIVFMIAAWKYLLLFGAIAFGIWLIITSFKE